MADYKEKIEEWQKTVRRKARELDDKYALSDLIDEGSRAAGEAARRGAETISSGAEKLRAEADRLAEDGDIGNTARRAASDACARQNRRGKSFATRRAISVSKPAGKLVMRSRRPKLTTNALRTFTTRARK
jgi:outer membrane murein-binding lipoprotein Lpp